MVRSAFSSGHLAQSLIVIAGTGLVALAWAIEPNPLGPAVIGLCFLAAVSAYQRPFLVCIMFICLSYFRLHEAYPFLYPLRLPFYIAVITIIAIVWHVFVARTVVLFWPAEINFFLAFFFIATIGIAYAIDRQLAFKVWQDSFSKIGIMTLAIAWLARRPEDFQLAARAFVISGILVAAVAIHNKLAGIGLVELTRVTIGRDLKSVLGDPNDLALVLLFPLSFAAALAFNRCGVFNRLLGLLSLPVILLAIVFTQSRGGLLGVVAVLSVLGLRFVKSKTLAIVLALFAAVALYYAMGISGRISGGSDEPGLDESAEQRLEAWSAAINMVAARPLTGVGLANFSSSLYLFATDYPGWDMVAHSTWFSVLGETGVPGTLAFLGMVAAGLRSVIRSLTRLRNADPKSVPPVVRATALALVAGMVGFCTAGSFLSQGFTWPIYMLVGLAAALSRYVSAEFKEDLPTAVRVSAIRHPV